MDSETLDAEPRMVGTLHHLPGWWREMREKEEAGRLRKEQRKKREKNKDERKEEETDGGQT